LACGSGLWTRHLVSPSRRVTAVDASPEAIALNRARVRDAEIQYVFHEPATLERQLRERDWSGWVRSSGKFFLYGSLARHRSVTATRF
jgi:methylase of polypeptide subunit release factors